MMRRKVSITPTLALLACILSFTLVTGFPLSSRAEDLAYYEKTLGKPPTGFSWYLCHNGFLGIRRPDGWFVKEAGPSANGTMACFVTKTKISDQNQGFETGFSINIIPKFLQRHGEQPSRYAKRFIDQLAKRTKENGGDVGEVYQSSNGPMQGLALRYTDLLPGVAGATGSKKTTLHQFLISNDQTSTLYVSAFESPAAEWNEAWAIGEKIIQQLGVLSNK